MVALAANRVLDFLDQPCRGCRKAQADALKAVEKAEGLSRELDARSAMLDQRESKCCRWEAELAERTGRMNFRCGLAVLVAGVLFVGTASVVALAF